MGSWKLSLWESVVMLTTWLQRVECLRTPLRRSDCGERPSLQVQEESTERSRERKHRCRRVSIRS
jgi:hypothetical protein